LAAAAEGRRLTAIDAEMGTHDAERALQDCGDFPQPPSCLALFAARGTSMRSCVRAYTHCVRWEAAVGAGSLDPPSSGITPSVHDNGCSAHVRMNVVFVRMRAACSAYSNLAAPPGRPWRVKAIRVATLPIFAKRHAAVEGEAPRSGKKKKVLRGLRRGLNACNTLVRGGGSCACVRAYVGMQSRGLVPRLTQTRREEKELRGKTVAPLELTSSY
jgi:hypothetical protein